MAIHFLWSPVDGKITLQCPEIEKHGYRKHTEKKNGLENHVYSEITRKFCYKEMAGNTLN